MHYRGRQGEGYRQEYRGTPARTARLFPDDEQLVYASCETARVGPDEVFERRGQAHEDDLEGAVEAGNFFWRHSSVNAEITDMTNNKHRTFVSVAPSASRAHLPA